MDLNNYPIVVKNPVLITNPKIGLLLNYFIDFIVVPENIVWFLWIYILYLLWDYLIRYFEIGND